MSLTETLRREWGYLKEDTTSAVASLQSKIHAPSFGAERRSRLALLAGASVLVASIFTWSPAVAGVIAGVAALFYGFFLVDLDSPSTRRRKRAAKRPKVTL